MLKESQSQCQIGKGAGPDKIQGFWLTSFTTVHEVLAAVLNECIELGDVPGWLVE